MVGAGKDELSELNSFLVYCLECPKIDEISEILTISGVASTNFADGIAFYIINCTFFQLLMLH